MIDFSKWSYDDLHDAYVRLMAAHERDESAAWTEYLHDGANESDLREWHRKFQEKVAEVEKQGS